MELKSKSGNKLPNRIRTGANMKFYRVLVVSLWLGLSLMAADGQVISQTDSVEKIQLGSIKNLCSVGELYCSGQFESNDIQLLKEKGIVRVISLRAKTEINWDEASELGKAGIEFSQIPISSANDLNDANLEEIRNLLKDQNKKTLLHCGIGGRVAAAWLSYRVLDQGISLEKGMAEAEQMGLGRSPMRDKVVDYINRQSKAAAKTGSNNSKAEKPMPQESKQEAPAIDPKKSVKPGINDSFLAEDLDVDEFVKKFEIESREIFVSRERILSACRIKKGMSVADIGAGTGLFTKLFSVNVGDEGWVYAIDIAPRFLEHINKTAAEAGLTNLSGILCTDRSAQLPKESVDIVFVCDTYHHFEYPSKTLASILKGLKPGGKLIIVDFERIPGVSRDWILGHVRAGKEVVRTEIEEAGFAFVEEVKIDGLQENYFLTFQKPK